MRKFKVEISSSKLISKNFYKITLFHVLKTYSLSFANFLRCVLFTSLKGFSITEVKIFGINSEFDSLAGVQEDVLNLILNLKGVIFKLKKKKKMILNLNKKGYCIVKASDFFLNEWVEIINPNHIIAHLSKNFNLNIVVKIEEGFGNYFINNNNYKKNKCINGILLDVNFSPILKVYYKINPSKLFFFENIDFYIKTNGTLSSKKALFKAFNILKFQLLNINSIYKNKVMLKKNNERKMIKLSDVNFSVNSLYYLKKMNVLNLGDLIKFTEKDILKISKLNFSFLKEIKTILSNYNLYLN